MGIRFDDTKLFWVFLILGSLFLHAIALPNPYYYDDFALLQDNAWLTQPLNSLPWFHSFYLDSHQNFIGFRPILMLSFYLNANVLGVYPWTFRVFNILLHTINGILLVHLLQLFLSNRKDRWLSWATGFLFLFHPCITLPISFLWKRSSLLETFFVLFALLLHARERKRQEAYRAAIVICQIALFGLACGTKESGILLPFFLLTMDVIFYRRQGHLFSLSIFWMYGAQAVLALIFLYVRLFLMQTWIGTHVFLFSTNRTTDAWTYLFTSLSILSKYFYLWLIPEPRILDDPPFVHTFPYFQASLSVLFFFGSLAWAFCKRNQPLLLFWMILLWASFLPTQTFWTLYLPMDQVRLYFPLAGLSFVLASSMAQLSDRLKSANVHFSPKYAVAILVCLYASYSGLQHIAYRNPERIWKDVIDTYPQSDIAWAQLATVFQEQNQHHKAFLAFSKAHELDPSYPGRLVRALYNRWQSGLSIRYLSSSLQDLSHHGLTSSDQFTLSIMLSALGEVSSAQQKLLEITIRDPSYGLAHLKLAQLWEQQGNMDDARRAYANAFILMPQNVEASLGHQRLGSP